MRLNYTQSQLNWFLAELNLVQQANSIGDFNHPTLVELPLRASSTAYLVRLCRTVLWPRDSWTAPSGLVQPPMQQGCQTVLQGLAKRSTVEIVVEHLLGAGSIGFEQRGLWCKLDWSILDSSTCFEQRAPLAWASWPTPEGRFKCLWPERKSNNKTSNQLDSHERSKDLFFFEISFWNRETWALPTPLPLWIPLSCTMIPTTQEIWNLNQSLHGITGNTPYDLKYLSNSCSIFVWN